ncbi:MAG: dTMP kinase [Chthonomonadales bacterium]
MPPEHDAGVQISRGVFITFEGVEGSGKSTQIALLQAAVRQGGISVSCFREPGGTPAGEQIRTVLLSHEADVTPAAELFLFLAARAELVAKAVAPALASGRWVLCDRYSDSTLAYQGYARGFPLDWLRSLNRFATQNVSPYLTILLDLDPRVGLARSTGRDRMEAEDEEFHRRVRQGFLDLAGQEPERFVVIDGTLPAQHIHRKVVDVVSSRTGVRLPCCSAGGECAPSPHMI